MGRTRQGEIKGLPPYQWRRLDNGQAQRREEEKISLGYANPSFREPLVLAQYLTDFAQQHDDATVDIDHTFSDHPDYSCDLALELVGWRDVTEDEVQRAIEGLAERARLEKAERRRRLEEELRTL